MALEVDDSGAQVVSDFLKAWAAALAARDVDTLAGLFDDAALFTATAPEPLRGQAQIRAYYDKAPPGRLGLSRVPRPQGWRVSAYQLSVRPQP